jgi:hypothetical protein
MSIGAFLIQALAESRSLLAFHINTNFKATTSGDASIS